MRGLVLAAALLSACGGGDSGDRPPAAPDVEGGASGGGSKSTSGSGSQSEAGEGGDAPGAGGSGAAVAGDGAGGEGIIYETAGAPSFEPGVCDPELMLGDAEAQGVGASGARLLSMTLDERTLAFLTGSGDAAVLHVADRSGTELDFTQHEVALPAGYEATRGVSLSQDGLRLLVTREDQDGFGELIRGTRDEDFGGAADETRFANINGLKQMTGRGLGWPVLSSDGGTLYYVSAFGQALVIQATAGAGGVFAYGKEIDEFTLGGAPGEYKLLSGISADQRAIFFWDEASGHAMALFRSHPDAPFYDPLDLGEREGATPNQDCSRIYSSLKGGVVRQAAE